MLLFSGICQTFSSLDVCLFISEERWHGRWCKLKTNANISIIYPMFGTFELLRALPFVPLKSMGVELLSFYSVLDKTGLLVKNDYTPTQSWSAILWSWPDSKTDSKTCFLPNRNHLLIHMSCCLCCSMTCGRWNRAIHLIKIGCLCHLWLPWRCHSILILLCSGWWNFPLSSRSSW